MTGSGYNATLCRDTDLCSRADAARPGGVLGRLSREKHVRDAASTKLRHTPMVCRQVHATGSFIIVHWE